MRFEHRQRFWRMRIHLLQSTQDGKEDEDLGGSEGRDFGGRGWENWGLQGKLFCCWNFDVMQNFLAHLLGKQPFQCKKVSPTPFFWRFWNEGSLLSLMSIATCHDLGVPEALQKSLLGEDEDGWVVVTFLKDLKRLWICPLALLSGNLVKSNDTHTHTKSWSITPAVSARKGNTFLKLTDFFDIIHRTKPDFTPDGWEKMHFFPADLSLGTEAGYGCRW